jgi:GDP-L-fucose synthase
MMRRFHEAKSNGDAKVVVWGSGNPLREFLHVNDMAAASIHILELDLVTYEKNTKEMMSHINVGTGVDCTIRELAETLKDVVGFDGKLEFDETKPDGAPRKLMDVSRLGSLGFKAQISLRNGLADTYQWFLNNQHSLRK